MLEFKTVRELYEVSFRGSNLEKESLNKIEIQGWVRTNRFNGTIGFLEVNDGTYFKNIQIVYNDQTINYENISKSLVGTAVTVMGKIVFTPNAKQAFELHAQEIVVEGMSDPDYPLQKKRHSFEFLRDIAHLRPRTNTFSAVFRVRSVLSMAIHEFFQSQGFVYLHSPIITGNDAEGAGEAFVVTTREDGKYERDFFGKKANLTVSGQLNAEAFALAFRDTYTFGPTFRAEKSHTSRHVAEFWMVEPEMAFATLEDSMDLAEDLVKFCLNYVLENCQAEMEFFDKMIEKDLLNKLNNIIDNDFMRITYTQAIERLQKAVAKGVKFEDENIFWGMDLHSEHEKYLCEVEFNGPLFLTDYPKEIKAFYMRLNDDEKTVAACDLLVPGIGEIIGGSQREERYEVLLRRLEELKIPQKGLEWYTDLRRYGGVKHAGFGLGFERFLMYITGMSNIRDVIPFPRAPKDLKF